jgi:PAS domain S-box-containing protein
MARLAGIMNLIRSTGAIVLFFGLLAVGVRAAPVVASAPRLETVAAIRQLTADQAATHEAVHLVGTLTFFDGNLYSCFFQDDTAGIYVVYDQGTNLPTLTTGQRVEIEGVTSPGEFAPVVVLKTIQVLGPAVFPAAQPVSYEELASGQEDSQFVEIHGIVRSVDFNAAEHYYHLKVATGGGFLTALSLSLPVADANSLVDAQLRIRGVCASRFNSQRQLFDLRLLVPRQEDVQVESPAPADPYNQPSRRIEQILQFVPQGPRGNRVKITGTVIYRRADDAMYVQDEHEGILVETHQTGALLPGDLVEVLGFPAKGEYTPKLEDAIFRKIGAGSVPVPKNITADEALKGAYDCRLVRLEGTVLDRTRYGHEQFLVVQSGGFIFNAYLEHKDGVNFSYLENGSRVTVTGVCVIDPGNDWHFGADWRAKSFRLLMRYPGDIYLLARAPWWNLQRMLWAVALLLLGVMLALAWVVILRRRVQKQTAIIRRQLQTEAALKERYEDLFENANDMVFTHDLEGRITSINKTGEQWLGRPREQILGQSLVPWVTEEQREAATQWLGQLVAGPDLAPVEFDFVNAAGHRFRLEISARLVALPGKSGEVESVARDITERKQLEREILQISNREQHRIGHDLHDGVCQQLAAIAYRVDILADQLSGKKLPESVEAERIGTLVNEAVSQTRSVARGLFPVRLEENGLASALEEVVLNAANLFRIRCRFSCAEPAPKPDATMALHLYYIAQEAVLNAAKHGRATEIQVAVTRQHDRFILTIEDNGSGFEINVRNPGGMGIRIMRYRAQVIGAALELKSQPGRGTQITCAFRAVA